MLEHMAFKGTKRRDAQAIATEVENVGGFMNAIQAVKKPRIIYGFCLNISTLALIFLLIF